MPEYFGKPNPDEVSKKWLQDLVNEGAIVETSLTLSPFMAQVPWEEIKETVDEEGVITTVKPMKLGAGGCGCKFNLNKTERQVDKDASFAAQEAALRADLREFMNKEGPDESQAGS